MNELAASIKARGYWQTSIRPLELSPTRIGDLSAVPELLSRLSINRRGWYFPHVGRPENTMVGNDWVGQDTVWENFRELWRVTRSGQMLHLAGIRYDWGEARFLSPMERVEPGEPIIGIGDTLHRMSEIFEFAQRWAQTVAEEDGVEVSVEIGGLLSRRLVVDHTTRGGTSVAYVSRAAEPWTMREEVGVGTTLEELWARARTASLSLFRRFGFQANAEVLQDWQRKIGN